MENLTPETRLEGYLAKIAGQEGETLEPKTRLEYYLNKIAENGGGTTPTGTISITSNGEHDVTNYATANVNVASDFGTAEVTIVNGSASHVVSAALPYTVSSESIDFAVGEFSVERGGTSTFNAITYKGKCLLAIWDYSYYNIVTSGAAESVGEGEYLITGNCTITISDEDVQDEEPGEPVQ